MLRVLLIDDEPIVRMTIKSLGPWEKYGFEMADEAQDGIDALDKLKTEKSFDIILTDISMPKMSGIEVIREIRQSDDQIPILVLSAFNDYPFVREAFKLGIQDYILKSELNFEALLELLQKSSYMISTAKKNNEQQRSNNIYLKQKFLENLLNGLIPDDAENQITNYKIQLTRANLNVAIISVDDYKVMEDKYDSVVLTNINHSILNLFNQKTSEFKIGELIVIGKGKYALISSISQENSMAVVLRKLSFFLNNVKQALMMLLNISVSIGVSGTQNGYHHIPSLYTQALTANGLKLLYGKGKMIYEHDLSRVENKVDGSLTEKSKDILQALFSQDQNQLMAEIAKIIKYTKNLNLHNINIAFSLYLEFIYMVMGHLYNKDLFAEDIFKSDINFMEQISRLETIDEMNQYIEHFLLSIFNEISQRSETVSSKVRTAKEYMKQHFREDITLKSVSEQIQVSEIYLSRLFSSETGESFISYLIRLRIEAAMDLLKNSQLTIHEISEYIGYANPEHFSRIFKKNVGCSPIKFRNENFYK